MLNEERRGMPRLYLCFSAPAKFLNSSTSYTRAHHRFAVFVVCATFVLLIAGGLVTSNDASLAVPDWPTSFGSFHMPRMVGGVLYEHGHRLIAASITLLTLALAVWTWMVDKQRWMQMLTAIAALGVVVLAVVGGLSVLSANWNAPALRIALATGHGIFGQVMFCVLAAVALFTSESWRRAPGVALPPEDATKLRFWTAFLVVALFGQSILGDAC